MGVFAHAPSGLVAPRRTDRIENRQEKRIARGLDDRPVKGLEALLIDSGRLASLTLH
jgi:hypothetical protein